MESAERYALLTHVIEHGKKRDLSIHACQVLRPYYDRALQGAYPLDPAKAYEPISSGRAIKQAVDKKVARIIALSQAAMSASDGMGARLRSEIFAGGITDALMLRYSSVLASRLGHRQREKLYELLDSDLMDKLNRGLTAGFRSGVDHSLYLCARSCVVETLYFYLGFILAGDKKFAGRLEPLTQLTLRALPLGEKIGEPGTWFVLFS